MMTVSKPLLPEKRFWWAGLGSLLLLGILLMYPNYDFSLPYIDHPDEPQFTLAADMIRGQGTARSMALDAYPPGIITVNFLALELFHDGDGLPTEVMGMVRLVSITFAWLTLIPVALLGYHLMNELASLLTAFIWLITPIIVGSARFAVADNFLTFFSVSSVLLAYLAAVYNRNGFATAALAMLLAGILFKTQAIFLLPIVYGLPLLRWFTQPDDRRELIQNAAANGLRIALFMVWLLLLYPTLRANDIPNWVAPTDEATLPGLSVVWQNLNIALGHFQPIIIWGMMLVPYAALLWSRYRTKDEKYTRVSSPMVLTLAASALAWLIGISIFGVQSVRQMYALYTFMLILSAGGVYIACQMLLNGLVGYVTWSVQRTRRIATGATVIGVAVFSVPSVMWDIEHIQNLGHPDVRVRIARYVDTSLPPAPYIATWSNHKTLNPAWGGVPMTHTFQMVQQASLFETSIEDWRDQNVTYALVPYQEWQRYDTDSLNITPLRAFPPSDVQRGASTVIAYLNRPGYLLNQQVGSIRYTGYDRNTDWIAAGDNLQVRFFWQADQPTVTANQLFVHVVADNEDIVAQLDTAPLFDARRSTDTWDIPDETLLSPVFEVPIPANIDPGTYRVISGFYDPSSMARQIAPDGDSTVKLFELTVTDPSN
jgi:hypothetical protein